MNASKAMALSIAALAAMAFQPAHAAPWARGYAVGFYEMAFRYGGRGDYTQGNEIEPGVDCPHGSTTNFANPSQAARTFALVPWFSKAEYDAVANPKLDPSKNQGGGGAFFGIWQSAASFRGYAKNIETYINPFAAEDPGEPEVQSHIGEGFNLDGKVKPADFVSPEGEQGIDNNLYRAWGCDAPWRGNGNGVLVLRSNDKMMEGLFSIVIRISGTKDPMNDDNAVVEIGYSPDKVMKDARGNTGVDYSYRILKGDQYTKLKAKIRNGMLETEQADIHMPQIAWFPDQNKDAEFHQGKLRLVMNADGTATGLVGGYRNWRDLYAQNTFAQHGGEQGVREHEDHVALYYALRRNADGMYNARTGRYDGISSAYRLKLAEAYVVDPAVPMARPAAAPGDMERVKSYNAGRAALIKAVDTLTVQVAPAESEEPGPGKAGGPRRNRPGGGAALASAEGQ